MPDLKLKLFGSPQIELDGSPLHLEGRIPVALLAYLAVTGQLHTRDTLATLFWPEHRQARTQLRNNWWVLKRDLGAWSRHWLYSDHETIGLPPDAAIWIDIEQFKTNIVSVQSHAHPGAALCPTCLTHLNQAVALYRDDFLAGFTLRDSPAFDEWQFFQRESLRRAFATCLEKLVQHHNLQGEFVPAIQHARRWLALDPLYEPAHRALIQLYAAAGEYAAAVRQYELCARDLLAELQAEPDPETEALYQIIRTKQLLPSLATAAQIHRNMPVANQTTALPAPSIVAKQPLPPNNLLEQLTPLVGREQECNWLQSYLHRSDVRLVTLTGTGGIGKTRLAMQVAADLLPGFAAGVYFVALAPIQEANLVIGAIAQTLGVREVSSRPLLESIASHLHNKSLLLVLDNFEHVINAAPLITDLLTRCPQLKILATSRESLHLRGEHEYDMPALAVPTSHQSTLAASLPHYAAVQLFIQRAQAVKANFTIDNASAPAVAEICRRLDGLPLAIELAAARCKFFSPQVLLQALTVSPLAVLRTGARDMPARHQTLHAAITWSYDLLNAAEHQFFQQLAVFVGGFTLEAVEQICAQADGDAVGVIDHLISLVDKSLVRQTMETDGAPSFMYLETIREFALERLQASGELVAIQQRHAGYYAGLAHTLCPQMVGPNSVRVLAQLRTNFPNIRIALQWLLAQRLVEDSLRLCNVLLDYWSITHSREAVVYIDAALALAADQSPTPAYVNALASAGYVRLVFNNGGDARHYFEQCLTLNRAIGNLGDPKKIGIANGLLGWIQFDQGDYPAALAYMAAAKQNDLATGDEWALAMTLANQGKMLAKLGEFEQAHRLLQDALAHHRRLGGAWGIAHTLVNQSLVYILQNNFEEAANTLAQSYPISQEIQAEGLLSDIYRFSVLIALHRDEHSNVELLLHKMLLIRQQATTPRYLLEALETMSQVAVKQNDWYLGVVLAGAISVCRQKINLVSAPVEKQLLENALAQAHQQLTPSVAATAWTAGEAMTLDQVTNYALAALSSGVSGQTPAQLDVRDLMPSA